MSATIPLPPIAQAKAEANCWVADEHGRRCEVEVTLKDGMVEVVTRSDLGLPVTVLPPAIRG